MARGKRHWPASLSAVPVSIVGSTAGRGDQAGVPRVQLVTLLAREFGRKVVLSLSPDEARGLAGQLDFAADEADTFSAPRVSR